MASIFFMNPPSFELALRTRVKTRVSFSTHHASSATVKTRGLP